MRNELDGPALDRWITGNYGEDQFKPFYCDKCEAGPFEDDIIKCPECGESFELE